jgi:hypothetical protein
MRSTSASLLGPRAAHRAGPPSTTSARGAAAASSRGKPGLDEVVPTRAASASPGIAASDAASRAGFQVRP